MPSIDEAMRLDDLLERKGAVDRYTGIVNSPRFEGRKLVAPDQLTISIGLRLVFGASDEAPPRKARELPAIAD